MTALVPGHGEPSGLLPQPLLLFGGPLLAFAAEDEGRTEEPTEHKLRKAREEGKVAKSGEFTSAVVLLAVVVTLALVARGMLDRMAGMLTFFLKSATEI